MISLLWVRFPTLGHIDLFRPGERSPSGFIVPDQGSETACGKSENRRNTLSQQNLRKINVRVTGNHVQRAHHPVCLHMESMAATERMVRRIQVEERPRAAVALKGRCPGFREPMHGMAAYTATGCAATEWIGRRLPNLPSFPTRSYRDRRQARCSWRSGGLGERCVWLGHGHLATRGSPPLAKRAPRRSHGRGGASLGLG